MNCPLCHRVNLTEKELEMHNKYYHNQAAGQQHFPPQVMPSGVCPECGTTLWFEEGCAKCHSCGFTKC